MGARLNLLVSLLALGPNFIAGSCFTRGRPATLSRHLMVCARRAETTWVSRTNVGKDAESDHRWPSIVYVLAGLPRYTAGGSSKSADPRAVALAYLDK